MQKILGLLISAILAAGCSTSEDTSHPCRLAELPEPRLWEAPSIEPPSGALIDRIPELADVSAWAGQVNYKDGPLPKTARMPYLGSGNGSVCCLMGTTSPLTTIHGLLGPTYQKGSLQAFFPDVTWTVENSGRPVSFDDETIWRVRRSAVILTRSRSPMLEMWTLTFTPFPEEWPGDAKPENQSLFRILYLRNLGSYGLENLAVRIQLAVGGEVEQGSLTMVSEDRRLRILVLGSEGHGAGSALILPIELAPGQEKGLAFVLVASSPRFPEAPVLEGIQGLSLSGVESDLAKTIRAWHDWYQQGAQLETPDPRVNDLVEGLVITNKVSTTIAGGPVEISHYSLVWNRDTYGPVRLFTAMGRDHETRGILDYHFVAVCHGGGLANAYPADLDPETAPPPPTAEDWARQGVFSGRTAAEGPSYLVLDYYRYLLLRGHLRDFEPSDLAARMDMLRACVYQQAITGEGLLPFSGDETFRPQMAISFGLGVEYPFEEKAWSFNSGVLLVAAAEALSRLEEEAAKVLKTDGSERVRKAREIAEQVRAATRKYFWNGEQAYFEPYLMRSDYAPAGAPYGDVDAVPFWLDVDFSNVSRESAAGTLVERLFSRQKVFFSPADPLLDLFLKRLIGEGIYTGMTPGFTLWTLASVSHPLAGEAFNTMDNHADDGGNYPEVVVHDDTSPLTLVYDAWGLVGEMWARYRSWEGAINGEAMLYFLSGFEEDAASHHIALAPRLPNSWSFFTLTGLRLGETGLDLQVERVSRSCMKIRVIYHGESPISATVRIPGPPIRYADLNGGFLRQGTRVGLVWGGTATDLDEVPLLPGENRFLIEFVNELL